MLLLFDISDSQIMKDYKRLKERTSGGFIRATKGITIKDKEFKTHWENTKKEGIPRGAYHFWIPSSDPKKQAKNFFNTVNATGDLGELPPVLDIEPKENTASADKARICAEEIENLFGRPPMIYTSKAYFDKLKGGKAWAGKYPLWVAHYITWEKSGENWDKNLLKWEENLIVNRVNPKKSDKPDFSSTWDEWQIWQFTDDGRGPDWGTKQSDSKQIDLNVFRGTLEELLALGGTTMDQLEEVTETIPEVEPTPLSDSLLEEIKEAGITPTIQININMTDFDLKAFKNLQSKLEEEGITPEVHINIQVGSGRVVSSGSDLEQEPDSGETELPISEPEPESSFTVEVKAKSGTKTAVQSIVDRKDNGVPVMEPYKPRIALSNGTRLRVSKTHKESDKDKGDGVIYGGKKRYYKITDDVENGEAAGNFVKKEDVKPA